MSIRTCLAVAALAAILALTITGCGSGVGLQLLTVDPSVTTGTVGGPVVQFSATGYYSDGSQKTDLDIKGLTWQTSDASVATITSAGVALCQSANTVTITAAAPGLNGTITATAQLTCQVAG